MANTPIPGITTLTGTLMTNLIRGYSAYEVAVQEGFDGTVEEWLASLVGESVSITVVEDTDDSFILEFSVGDEVVRTPNLRENLNDMKQQISDMQTQVSHHSAEIINLRTADASLDDRVTALENGAGSDLAVRVTVLEEQVNAHGTQISALETDVDDLKTSAVDLDDALQALDSHVSNLDTSVTNHTASIAEITSDVSDLSSDVNELKNQFSDLSNKFGTYIDSTDVDLDQLSEIVSYIKNITAIEVVDELPSPDEADPKKIYILRSSQGQEVGG